MKKLAALAFSAFLFASPSGAFAQMPPASPAQAAQAQGVYPPVGAPMPSVIVDQRPPADTSFSFGTGASQLLGWLALVFGGPIASYAVLWLRALAKKAGVEMSQAMSDELQDKFKRGMTAEAAKIGADLDGKLTVDVQNKLLAAGVDYVKAHGINTVKDLSARNSALGFLKSFDPSDPKVQEALAARATTALNEITPNTVLATSAAATEAAKSATTEEKTTTAAVPVAEPAPGAAPSAV